MGYGNVPDDWSCYFHRCGRCGARYHASEGGCSCLDGLRCQCGKDNWEDVCDGYECRDCGTGPHEDGGTHITVHIARKAHGINIRPGDKYRRCVDFGHYPGGAFTLKVRKVRLEKGPAWPTAEAA